VHWAVMTGWVVWQHTEFCTNRWEERLYNAVIGLVYCFSFFSLKEGRSRYRQAAFQVGLEKTRVFYYKKTSPVVFLFFFVFFCFFVFFVFWGFLFFFGFFMYLPRRESF
jgi:hypothetical protein